MKTFDVINPATAAVVDRAPDQSVVEAKDALERSVAAFASWKQTTAFQRSAVLRKWYELILNDEATLASLMSGEMGKPITEARGEVKYAAAFVEWYAEEAKRAYGEINEFEAMLIDDGVRMVKIFMHISYEKQVERFIERTEDPFKRWKMTPDDLRNLKRRKDYEQAIEEMLAKTWTRKAPWHLVSGENKNHARVRILNLIADELGRGLDLKPPPWLVRALAR